MFIDKFQAGEAVLAVMLGNSVGMGYYATDFEVIKTLYGPSRNFAAEYRTSDLPGGNPRMLRAFLKSRTLIRT